MLKTAAPLISVSFGLASLGLVSTALSAELSEASSPKAQVSETQTIQELQDRIDYLETTFDQRLNAVADAIESQDPPSNKKAIHIGGYGELHYNHLDANGEDFRELDLHRMVLFFGYDFAEWARFVSEFEVEHVIASGGSRGAVEVEQAYVEIDLKPNMHLQTGLMLMPIGIINETHEPPTFYGVERPIVETTIIPTTWFSAGMKYAHHLDNGLSYDLMISDGLKTEDPTNDPSAEPFNLKSGKQKGSFAAAYDLAMTGRIAYRGIAGLEIAAYGQYQPDLDQSAEISYAESATLLGGHVIYQIGNFETRALYARWDLEGDDAETAGMAVQDGGYVELSWKPQERWGLFVRQSSWSQEESLNATQSDVGVNFYPHPDIVFKADYQIQNDDAGNTDGFNLGMGYQF